MRFFGIVGYGTPSEGQNGVWADTITERNYYGDVVKDNRRVVSGQEVNSNVTTSNSIEIIADPYAMDHSSAIKYVEWAGALWKVTETEIKRPRLILRLGEVYDGSRPTTNAAANQSTTGTPDPSGRDSGR
jgi:hypothetical protein